MTEDGYMENNALPQLEPLRPWLDRWGITQVGYLRKVRKGEVPATLKVGHDHLVDGAAMRAHEAAALAGHGKAKTEGGDR